MLIARLIADPDATYNACDAIDNDIDELGLGPRDFRLTSFPGFEQFEFAGGDDVAGYIRMLDAYFPDADMLA